MTCGWSPASSAQNEDSNPVLNIPDNQLFSLLYACGRPGFDPLAEADKCALLIVEDIGSNDLLFDVGKVVIVCDSRQDLQDLLKRLNNPMT